jgi:signal peptidase II
MKKRINIFLLLMTSLFFIGCDRATKDFAKEHLKDKEPISYFHDTFRLLYVENTGAMLSVGDNIPQPYNFILLSIFPLVFLIGLFVYSIKKAGEISSMKMFSLSLIFAGGIGNIIDRIFFDRHVTDFMNIGILNVRTGIFNVADVCVTIGVISLLIFFADKKNKEKEMASLNDN